MFRSRVRPPFPVYIGFGFIIGIAIMMVILSPRVVSVTPDPEEQSLSAAGEIRLEFNSPMIMESVVKHLAVNPGGSETLFWEGDTLIIRPQEQWPAGETVEVRLSAGTRSERIIPTVFSQSWEFQTAPPRVAYLWPAFGKAELFLKEIDREGDAIKMTDTPFGIRDYTVSGDGGSIVYTANQVGDDTELYVLDPVSGVTRQLLSCSDGIQCQSPALSSDGEWVAYELTEFTEGVGGKPVPNQQSIWVLPMDGSADAVMVSDPGHASFNPDWSPSGLLSFFDNSLKAVVLMALDETGTFQVENYIPNSLGHKGGWSPDGTGVIFAEIVFPEEIVEESTEREIELPEGETFFFSHLYHTDLSTGRVEDLSPGGEPRVEDSSPVYNPRGDLVAFVRRYLNQSQWALGRQIWIMQEDGSIATALTDDIEVNHSSISWGPDSQKLLFMRGAVKDLMQNPEVVWMDIETGESVSIIEGGYLPRWVP